MGLDWVYVPFNVLPESIPAAVAALRAFDMVGTNVTVPHKEAVIAHLDEIDDDARRVGSVNTIVNNAGRLKGYSTDGPGLLWDLERQGVSVDGKRVLLWGAGGSARAVGYALSQRGCSVRIANRTVERAVNLAELIGGDTEAIDQTGASYADAVANADLLVNTTSLGMGPASIDLMPPVPDGALHAGQVVYDLVYVPETTLLLANAGSAGCRAIGGIGMLVCQGAVSLSHWTGRPLAEIPVDVMIAALAR
jgi:shikimate dehydrogenase